MAPQNLAGDLLAHQPGHRAQQGQCKIAPDGDPGGNAQQVNHHRQGHDPAARPRHPAENTHQQARGCGRAPMERSPGSRHGAPGVS